MWAWAKEVLNREQLYDKLLLPTDDKEQTALHHLTLRDNIQILQRIWKWASEQLTAEEDSELNAWHVAAKTGNTEKVRNYRNV